MTDRIDVSELKDYAFGYNAPIWWGQLLMAVIEGTMFVLLIGAYLYERMHFVSWPPPGSNTQGLLLPTVNLLILLGSCIPMHLADKAVMKCEWQIHKIGMAVTIAMGVIALALQVYLWGRFEFAWYTNLYGSYIWLLLGLHTSHLVGALTESVVMAALPLLGYKSDKVRQGLNVDEIYWYFAVVSALFVYGVVFYAPRFL